MSRPAWARLIAAAVVILSLAQWCSTAGPTSSYEHRLERKNEELRACIAAHERSKYSDPGFAKWEIGANCP